MKYIFLTNIVSPHQLPWCREFVKLVGTTNFLYLAVEKMHSQRKELGWGNHAENWIQILEENPEQENLRQQLETCDVLFCSLREFELFQQRSKRGLKSFYLFERWFKPPVGMLRMLHPGYLRMCYRAAKTFSMEQVHLMPIGIFAAQDMARMQAILHGKLQNLLWPPRTKNFVRKPMVAIDQEANSTSAAMCLWGYFVEPSQGSHEGPSESKVLRILWCGRMLDWKRVDTLVKASVALLQQGEKLHLRLIGYGPEEARLRRLVGNWLVDNDTGSGISFQAPVEIGAIRGIMRQSDVYVLCSDGGEGWGAVVNEAMAEGCTVIGTHEAGSSATMIEHGVNGWLFPAGNVRKLKECLLKEIQRKQRGEPNQLGQAAARTLSEVWSPSAAAQTLLREISQ
jgi:hypothetical protein